MDSRPKITVLLMNYKREENLPIIINALKSQTIPCKLFLWNNAEEPYQDNRLDLIINSSDNLKCWPRWSMAAYTDTEYVMTHDDDLCFTVPDALESIMRAYEENETPRLAVGFTGVRLGSDLSYYPTKAQKKVRKYGVTIGAKHYKFPKEDTQVDVVKGRIIFCKREDLRDLPLYLDCDDCDDIFVSGFLSKGERGKHIITNILNDKIEELPGGDGEMAISNNTNWEEFRSSLTRKYFKK